MLRYDDIQLLLRKSTDTLAKIMTNNRHGVVHGLRRRLTGGLFAIMLVVAGAVSPSCANAEENDKLLQPITCSEMFVVPGQSTVIRLTAGKATLTDKLEYTLTDYFGTEVGKGTLSRNGQAREYTALLQLAQGFYELNVAATGQRLGIVALPAYNGRQDEFFALETLLENQPETVISDRVQLVKRYGIGCVREYTPWFELEKTEGKFDLSFDKAYHCMAKNDVKAVFFSSRFPEWTGADNTTTSAGFYPYPKNLLKLENPLVNMISRRVPGLAAFQIMNETELLEFPGCSVMPALEACSWFMAKHKINLPLGSPGFSSWNVSPDYLEPYFAGGILDYIDIFAFHSYHQPEKMIDLIKTYRGFMKAHPKAGIPLWITESGKPWLTGVENPQTVYGGNLGRLRGTMEHDIDSASGITMKAVEAKAGGVARYFPFVMRFFKEGINNFGMTDFYGSPMRSIAAYFNCVRLLSGKEYVGDLKALSGQVKMARVFAGDNATLAVIYTGNNAPTELDFTGVPVLGISTLDGRPLVPDSRGKVRFAGGLIYVALDNSILTSGLNTDTEAMSMLKIARSYRTVPRQANPVVFQFADWKIPYQDQRGYNADPKRIEINAYNFSDRELRIVPELLLPDGMKITGSSQATAEVSLPPNSSSPLWWTIDTGKNIREKIEIRLRDKNRLAGELVLPFLSIENARTASLEFADPARWRNNSSGQMTIAWDQSEKAVRVHADFTKGDFWCYPEYVLTLPQENFDRVMAVSFEIKMKQGNGASRLQHSIFMLSLDITNKEKYTGLKYKEPGEDWQRRIVFIPAAKRSNVKMIKLGMGPTDKTLDFWVRNMKVHYISNN